MELLFISAWSITMFSLMLKVARELKYKISWLFTIGLILFGILSVISVVIFIPLFLLGF